MHTSSIEYVYYMDTYSIHILNLKLEHFLYLLSKVGNFLFKSETDENIFVVL